MATFDIFFLYAYMDKAYARERELWKKFLIFLLPPLLDLTTVELSECIENAIVGSPEDAIHHVKQSSPFQKGKARFPFEIIREVSCVLAQEMGLSAEWGLASFVDCVPPTRLYKVSFAYPHSDEKTMVACWLENFSKIEQDSDFIRKLNFWKDELNDQENPMDYDQDVEYFENEESKIA